MTQPTAAQLEARSRAVAKTQGTTTLGAAIDAARRENA